MRSRDQTGAAMIEDARQVATGSIIDCDVAIIGGGAAGITLARELSKTNLQICLLESGAQAPETDTQALYRGEIAGRWYFPLDSCRLRFLGGSTNHWGGWCRPLSPIDFERRDWLPHSGWPITRADLDPYYQRAQPIIETGPFRYESTAHWEAQTGEKMLPFPGGTITTRFFQYSPPTRFGSRYRDELDQSARLRVLLNANVLEIETNESAAQVTGLKVATLDGPQFTVRARRYLLAAGGIENARILLLSNRAQAAGLGNSHDLVGRFFMEHPHIPVAANLVTNRPQAFASLYTQRRIFDGTTVKAALVPSDSLQRDVQLQSAGFTMGVIELYTADGRALPEKKDDAHTRDVFNVLHDLADGSMTTGTDLPNTRIWPPPGTLGANLALGCACEQAPNPDSRVRLSGDRDALGLQRPRLEWRLADGDKQSLNRVVNAIGIEFGRMGLGRLRPTLTDDTVWPDEVLGGNHHMGTTRMAEDPAQGVVDANCKVHGVANLYVAGSSVFPTSGAANPTLTIVALALRLADHIREGLS